MGPALVGDVDHGCPTGASQCANGDAGIADRDDHVAVSTPARPPLGADPAYGGAMAVTLQQLEIFRAVARNLSFSLAAKEAYTSQPHVSNQIRKLEQHYRVPLFVRSRPGISLTEAGSALYDRITAILDDVAEAEQVIQQFRGLQRGSVTVAATASAGNHVLPGLLADFHHEHPEIVVRLNVSNTEDVAELVERDEAELAITPRRPSTTELESERFYTEDLVVLAPSALDLAPEIDVDALAGLPLIAREEGSLTLTILNQLLANHTVEYVAQLSGTTAVNEAVASGLGVSLVPERSGHPWLQAGSVTISRIAGHRPQHRFHLVHSTQRYITPATRALINHLHRWGVDNDQRQLSER